MCGWNYVGRTEENVMRKQNKSNADFLLSYLVFLDAPILSVFLTHFYNLSPNWGFLRLKKKLENCSFIYWNFPNTIWTALGQQHIPVGKHLVALKIFTWVSRESSVICDDMATSASLIIKKRFIIYIRSYTTDTDLLSVVT